MRIVIITVINSERGFAGTPTDATDHCTHARVEIIIIIITCSAGGGLN